MEMRFQMRPLATAAKQFKYNLYINGESDVFRTMAV
jgi:hypothetical protein